MTAIIAITIITPTHIPVLNTSPINSQPENNTDICKKNIRTNNFFIMAIFYFYDL